MSFPEGSSLLDIYQGFGLDLPYPVVSAKVNNSSQGLKFRVYHNRDVEFLDITDSSGMRVYTRSLCFVLYKAASDVFPGSSLYIEHSISRGYYCIIRRADSIQVTEEEVKQIRERMQEIIDLDMPFRRNEVHTEEAVRIFRERGFEDKVKLLETSESVYTDYYTLGDTVDYYYGALLPSAGYLMVWGLEKFHDGMLLRIPDSHHPEQLAPMVNQPKTFEIFSRESTLEYHYGTLQCR